MSGRATQLVPRAALGPLVKGRRPLAHLLHALNQPLTGLQCSLELAVAGPRPTEYYIRTLQEGLELTHRMRILVAAIRELSDTEQFDPRAVAPFLLDALLRETADDLLPVAETRKVRLLLQCDQALPVKADRRRLGVFMFRLLESALSLAREESGLRVTAAAQPEHACLTISWNQGPPPEHSPFSGPELGLLLAQAGWEQAGAEWTVTRTETSQACTIRLPLASARPHCDSADMEI